MIHPEILSSGNIPKPLHGVNPRTILGREWWDKKRQEVYASTDYHCYACGVHKSQAKGPKWLESHESYMIDYEKGIVDITDIVPLCHYCHNFIHSGRLSKIGRSEKSYYEVQDIIRHGLAILGDSKLKAFFWTCEYAESLHINPAMYGVDRWYPPKSEVQWGEWRMLFMGNEYKPKFSTFEEWMEYYECQ